MLRVVAETEPFFENHTGVDSVAMSEFSIDPAGALLRLGERLQAVSQNTLVVAAIKMADGQWRGGVYWATTSWPFEPRWLGVRANISLVETLSGEILPREGAIHGECQVLTSAEDFDVLRTVAECYADPPAAVALVAHQIRRSGCMLAQNLTVSSGAPFVHSIERLGLQHQPAILEKLFHRAALAANGTLHERAGAEVHPVRTTSAGNAPQVERADGAKLWRCAVTKRGAGYRLHYWALPGRGIELDEVMVESEVGR
jgi:hypothetical protein